MTDGASDGAVDAGRRGRGGRSRRRSRCRGRRRCGRAATGRDQHGQAHEQGQSGTSDAHVSSSRSRTGRPRRSADQGSFRPGSRSTLPADRWAHRSDPERRAARSKRSGQRLPSGRAGVISGRARPDAPRTRLRSDGSGVHRRSLSGLPATARRPSDPVESGHLAVADLAPRRRQPAPARPRSRADLPPPVDPRGDGPARAAGLARSVPRPQRRRHARPRTAGSHAAPAARAQGVHAAHRRGDAWADPGDRRRPARRRSRAPARSTSSPTMSNRCR